MQKVLLTPSGVLLSVEAVGGRQLSAAMLEEAFAEARRRFFPDGDFAIDDAMPLFGEPPTKHEKEL